MNKTLITMMFLCIASFAMAQEPNKTEIKEIKMNVGDTIMWKPFDNCDALGYRFSGKAISFNPSKSGNQIQVIAQKVGGSSITATCNDSIVVIARITVMAPVVPTVMVKLEKPQTQDFTAVYNFNPPANNFFVTVNNPDSKCRETYVKIGDKEAFNDGQGFDRIWDIKTGENWYYCPDAQGWTDDVKWEFEPLGKSFFPLNSFDKEVNKNNLSNYYVGMERVLDVNCWHFFVDNEDGSAIQYWVDPANGCTLKRQVNNELPREVTVYDLKYTKMHFGPTFKKGLHDARR